MIKYKIFPNSCEITPQLRHIINLFESVNAKCPSAEILEQIRPSLQSEGYEVKTGRAVKCQVKVPVCSRNNKILDEFSVDAINKGYGIVLKIEAGRGTQNNEFLKDIFQACMMNKVEYLVIAVLNEYTFGKNQKSYDYEKVTSFLNTLYENDRLKLPLKGILIIGY